MGRFLNVGAALSLFLTSSAWGQEPARFALNVTMYEGEELLAEPKLSVDEGSPATIEIEGAQKSFKLSFILTPIDDGRIGLAATVDANSPTVGNIEAEPTLSVLPGEMNEIALGNISPELRPLRIKLTVNPE